jgi:hypothetical protein
LFDETHTPREPWKELYFVGVIEFRGAASSSQQAGTGAKPTSMEHQNRKNEKQRALLQRGGLARASRRSHCDTDQVGCAALTCS